MSLNMDNLELTKKWAKEVRMWTLDDAVKAVAGVAFDLWDMRYPRDLWIIMPIFIERMKASEHAVKYISTWTYELSLIDFTKLIYETLYSIKDFRKWNLTTTEYEHGVDPDSDKPNEWFALGERDFIDLEAFGQNVYCDLRSKIIVEHFFEL